MRSPPHSWTQSGAGCDLVKGTIMEIVPLPAPTKRCSTCRQDLPHSEFQRNAVKPDGLQNNCKVCKKAATQKWAAKNAEHVAAHARSKHLNNTYGISPEEYAKRLAAQNGLCAICRQPESSTHWKGKRMMLHIDHDHATGEVRGLLCHSCNTGIGLLQESPALLLAAHAYLTGS